MGLSIYIDWSRPLQTRVGYHEVEHAESVLVDSSSCSSEPSGSFCSVDNVHIGVKLVGKKVKALGGRDRERKLRVVTWNFSGLGRERRQEIGELSRKNSIDVVAGQESLEREDTRIEVEGYKWFGKPRSYRNSCRWEGRVGFLVCECMVTEVKFIMWSVMRVCG